MREPLTTHIKNGNYDLVSLPPPSGGLVLLHMLKILDGERAQLLIKNQSLIFCLSGIST